MNRLVVTATSETIDPPEDAGLPAWARRLITLWLVIHLLAIVSTPLSIPPSSAFSRAMAWCFRPYAQTLYLNHGYHYFAPDPGESTLLEFTVERADGTLVESAIPRREIFPRLLYHRHFMLTESLAYVSAYSEGQRFAQEQLRLAEDQPAAEDLEQSSSQDDIESSQLEGSAGDTAVSEVRGFMADWYASYAACLMAKYDGQRVTLTRVVHHLPELEWMQVGLADHPHALEALMQGEDPEAQQRLEAIRLLLTLSEPGSYQRIPLGTFTRNGEYLAPDPENMPDTASENDDAAANGPEGDDALTPGIAGGTRE